MLPIINSIRGETLTATDATLPLAVAAAAAKHGSGRSTDVELAQMPSPFGAPRPIIPGQQYSRETQKILKLQGDAFKALQKLS